MELPHASTPALPPAARDAVAELTNTFRRAADKYDAHARAKPLLEQLTRSSAFMTAIIEHHLESAPVYTTRNYPVVALPIVRTPHFELVANCWIPLPDGRTDWSTKSIHHHGKLLLSTATLFGPGYEHWLFTMPRRIDAARELFQMELLDVSPHPRHHVAFVDAWTAHVPMYPPGLTITLALWSNNARTTWRDWVKQVPVVRNNKPRLLDLAKKLGLQRQLDINVVEYFDYHPAEHGFKGIAVREEFPRATVEDHLHSFFHIVQNTGNAQLGRLARARLDAARDVAPAARATAEALLADLAADRPITGRLSPGHTDMPTANYSRADIERALRATAATTPQPTTTQQDAQHDARKLTATPRA